MRHLALLYVDNIVGDMVECDWTLALDPRGPAINFNFPDEPTVLKVERDLPATHVVAYHDNAPISCVTFRDLGLPVDRLPPGDSVTIVRRG